MKLNLLKLIGSFLPKNALPARPTGIGNDFKSVLKDVVPAPPRIEQPISSDVKTPPAEKPAVSFEARYSEQHVQADNKLPQRSKLKATASATASVRPKQLQSATPVKEVSNGIVLSKPVETTAWESDFKRSKTEVPPITSAIPRARETEDANREVAKEKERRDPTETVSSQRRRTAHAVAGTSNATAAPTVTAHVLSLTKPSPTPELAAKHTGTSINEPAAPQRREQVGQAEKTETSQDLAHAPRLRTVGREATIAEPKWRGVETISPARIPLPDATPVNNRTTSYIRPPLAPKPAGSPTDGVNVVVKRPTHRVIVSSDLSTQTSETKSPAVSSGAPSRTAEMNKVVGDSVNYSIPERGAPSARTERANPDMIRSESRQPKPRTASEGARNQSNTRRSNDMMPTPSGMMYRESTSVLPNSSRHAEVTRAVVSSHSRNVDAQHSKNLPLHSGQSEKVVSAKPGKDTVLVDNRSRDLIRAQRQTSNPETRQVIAREELPSANHNGETVGKITKFAGGPEFTPNAGTKEVRGSDAIRLELATPAERSTTERSHAAVHPKYTPGAPESKSAKPTQHPVIGHSPARTVLGRVSESISVPKNSTAATSPVEEISINAKASDRSAVIRRVAELSNISEPSFTDQQPKPGSTAQVLDTARTAALGIAAMKSAHATENATASEPRVQQHGGKVAPAPKQVNVDEPIRDAVRASIGMSSASANGREAIGQIAMPRTSDSVVSSEKPISVPLPNAKAETQDSNSSIKRDQAESIRVSPRERAISADSAAASRSTTQAAIAEDARRPGQVVLGRPVNRTRSAGELKIDPKNLTSDTVKQALPAEQPQKVSDIQQHSDLPKSTAMLRSEKLAEPGAVVSGNETGERANVSRLALEYGAERSHPSVTHVASTGTAQFENSASVQNQRTNSAVTQRTETRVPTGDGTSNLEKKLGGPSLIGSSRAERERVSQPVSELKPLESSRRPNETHATSPKETEAATPARTESSQSKQPAEPYTPQSTVSTPAQKSHEPTAEPVLQKADVLARAPQSETLKAALQQALEMSRKRLVEPDELRLSLPFGDLGTLDIDVARQSETYSIHIAAEPSVAAVLEESKVALVSWMREQGYAVERLDLSVRHDLQPQSSHLGDRQAANGTEKRTHAAHGAARNLLANDDSSTQQAARPSHSGAHVWTA